MTKWEPEPSCDGPSMGRLGRILQKKRMEEEKDDDKDDYNITHDD